MAPEPTGEGLSDRDLDEIVSSIDQEEGTSPTDAPEAVPADPAPSPEDDSDTSPDSPDTAPAGDEDTAPTEAPHPEESGSAPAVPAGKPFEFKANGATQVLPYAEERPDGSVVIPKESRDEFRRELESARGLAQNFRRQKAEWDRQLTQERTKRTVKDAEADAVIGLMSELSRKTPEEQWAYLQEFQGNIPRLQLDLERRAIEEQRKLIEQERNGPVKTPEQQEAEVLEQVGAQLDLTFQYVEQAEEFKALTPQEKAAVRARWQKNPARLVREATEDDAAQGWQPGALVFDPADLLDDLKFLAGAKKQHVSSAAQRNAAMNADQKSVNPIPPVVKVKPPVQQPRGKDGKFKGGPRDQAWRDAFARGDFDADVA
jgi:hypothetical protein